MAISFALAAVCGRASAQEDVPFARHRLGLDVGVGSAIGGVGLVYEYAPTRIVRLEGGLGLGLSGAQLSIMPKLVAGGGTCGFVAGLGPSVGLGGPVGESESSPTSPPRSEPSVIPWLNLDVPGVECHADNGLSFHATLGVTMALRAFHYEIADTGTTVHAGSVLPQLRFGFGWWW